VYYYLFDKAPSAHPPDQHTHVCIMSFAPNRIQSEHKEMHTNIF